MTGASRRMISHDSRTKVYEIREISVNTVNWPEPWPVMESRKFVARVLSRDSFSCLSLGSVSTLVCLVLALYRVFHVSSCLVSHDCVLTVSVSVIAKCLFCVDSLVFLVKRMPLGPFIRCLLTYYKQLFLQLLLFYGCILITVGLLWESQTFSQCHSLVST